MEITRGYRTELDPTIKQRMHLSQCAGVSRFTYNFGLARKQEVYQATGKTISAIDLQKELTARKHTDLPWLSDVSKWIVQNSLRDLDQAYAHFFRRVKERKAGKKHQKLGFPTFKSKRRGRGSFRLDTPISVFDDRIQLPKLGIIRLKEHSYLPTSEDVFRRDRIPSYGRVWERRLHDLWGNPDLSLMDIARHLGVSLPTVQRQAKNLMLPPRSSGRKKEVKSPMERQGLEQRRNEWIRLIQEHGGDGLIGLSRNIPGAQVLYNWLNKYDREWLCAHFPPKKPRRVKESLRTQFQAPDEDALKNRKEDRDVHTAHSIQLVAQQVKNAPEKPKRVTQAQLRRAVPSLGWLLSSPKRYPLTVQTFQEALETWEAFALRRIDWALEKCQEEALRPTRNKFRVMIQASRAWDIPSVQVAFEAALTELDEMAHEPQTLPQLLDADFIVRSGVYL